MDLRDAFFDSLFEIMKDDNNIYFLTGDMIALSLGQHKHELGDRFINVGICEQNMISVAAGLALSGKRVCAYAITPFITERCYQQIKVDLCCMNLPVMLIGSGVGLTYSYDGPTHHTLNDIAIMRTLPNLSIYSPSSPKINALVAELAYKNNGPSYIRLDSGNFPEIYSDDYAREICFIDEEDVVESISGNILFISTGTNIYDVRDVVHSLNFQGIKSSYLDLCRIKPLNEKKIIEFIYKYKKIVIVEEHSNIGGIGSLISELMIKYSIYKPIKIISLPDEFCKKCGDRKWVKKQYGLDMDSILITVLKWNEDIDEKSF